MLSAKFHTAKLSITKSLPKDLFRFSGNLAQRPRSFGQTCKMIARSIVPAPFGRGKGEGAQHGRGWPAGPGAGAQLKGGTSGSAR
jgi:hypothetical protein